MERTYDTLDGQDAAYRIGKRRISWGALFAGLIIALVIHLMLGMLGTGIGLSTIDPAQTGGSPQASSFGIGAGIWWVVSSTLAVFAGAWVAGRLCGFRKTTEGGLHGLLVWGLSTLLTVYLLGTAVSGVIAATTSAIGTAVSATAQGAAAVAPAIGDQMSGNDGGDGQSALKKAQQELKQLLAESGDPDLQPQAIEQEVEQGVQQARQTATSPQPSDGQLSAALNKLMSTGQEIASEVDKQDLANMLAARTDMSQTEARQRIDQWQQTAGQVANQAGQQIDQIQQQARQAADQAADVTAKAALWGFVAFLIGAIAAAFGGVIGARSTPVEPTPAVTTTRTGRPAV